MNIIVLAIVSVSVIGLICSVVLSIASKIMAVPVDETQVKIRECLPGANCGACGYAGCDGYAQALSSGEESSTVKCVPGSDTVAAKIAEIMGVEAQDVVEQDAICIEKGIAHIDTRRCIGCGLCAKTCPQHLITTENDTIKTMVTCSNHDKGAVTRKACTHGCLACQKCVRTCPAQAISMDNNVAKIDYTKCESCGQCSQVCPTGCIMDADFRGMFNAKESA